MNVPVQVAVALNAPIAAEPFASDCNVKTPGLVLVIDVVVPVGKIIDVEPRLKVPVLLNEVLCAFRLMTQEDPEVPAKNVPELVMFDLKVAAVMLDAESAVKVAVLFKTWALPPEPKKLMAVPFIFIVAPAPVFCMLAPWPDRVYVEAWSFQVPELVIELPEVLKAKAHELCVVNVAPELFWMALSFPKLKVVPVALNVPELLKKAPAPERLIVAELHVTVAPLEFCSELLSFPKVSVPEVMFILPELVTVEGVPVKLKLPPPVTLIVPVLVMFAVELTVHALQLSVPALLIFAIPSPLLRFTVPVKVTVAPEPIAN